MSHSDKHQMLKVEGEVDMLSVTQGAMDIARGFLRMLSSVRPALAIQAINTSPRCVPSVASGGAVEHMTEAVQHRQP